MVGSVWNVPTDHSDYRNSVWVDKELTLDSIPGHDSHTISPAAGPPW